MSAFRVLATAETDPSTRFDRIGWYYNDIALYPVVLITTLCFNIGISVYIFVVAWAEVMKCETGYADYATGLWVNLFASLVLLWMWISECVMQYYAKVHSSRLQIQSSAARTLILNYMVDWIVLSAIMFWLWASWSYSYSIAGPKYAYIAGGAVNTVVGLVFEVAVYRNWRSANRVRTYESA